MNYFDYLETRFTEANSSMATGNPNDVTVWRQAKVNATLNLVGMSRKVLQWAYTLYLLANYTALKLRLVKVPEFKSSIPAPKKPELSVVANEQPKSNP